MDPLVHSEATSCHGTDPVSNEQWSPRELRRSGRASSEYRRSIEDSLRWRDFEHRLDDIFIRTPPKSGTTWMQGIVSSLLWPAGDAPDDRSGRSPWIDARFTPIDELLAQLDGQEHLRFIKTHSPADCVPIFEECKYVTVYRDGRDALMSWSNHRAEMRPEFIEMLNATGAEEGLRPTWPRGGHCATRSSHTSCTTTI